MSHLPETPVDPRAQRALIAYLISLEAISRPAGYRAPLMVTVTLTPLGVPR